MSCTQAVNIQFENCLDRSITTSNPLRLQFTPLYLSASFNTSSTDYNLNITVYGNVSGQAIQGSYPPPGDPRWSNPNDTFGKIVDVSESNNKFTTLFSKFEVLSYTPYNAEPIPFCASLINGSCPLGPSFGVDRSDQYSLPRFSVSHNFLSSYSFSTFASTIRIQSGDTGAVDIACVSANITPDLGHTLSDTLTYLPAAIVALVAVATIFAAIFSPWGSSDPFRWTSNYGRDEDLLRLVTPGFGDCLQYIQFIILTGSLNLNYPGYYQPIVSQASWSVLMFNESMVSNGPGTQSLVDGIYNITSENTYGLTRLSQLVGMSEDYDIWADMAIWLCSIVGGVLVLCQVAFGSRWAFRKLLNHQPEDLRSKNLPFSLGNAIRIVFNYFLLPIITFSTFQLVLAYKSPTAVVITAVLLLVAVLGSVGWIFWLIFTTRPRAHLFDDLPTVLMYGPLYNTYSDDAAPFAFIPVLLTVIRGIAIGAVQPSGIAQIILLAICEVIFILTLHAFRPFQAPTSMNAYHTFFSVVRLVTILLSVTFVPSLGVSEPQRGWLGYVILLLHAIVLVFGFFLNSIQTLIEVVARLAGAGGDARGGLATVFGMRELSRRNQRRRPRHHHQRSSLNSNSAMLAHDTDNKDGRARSLSASSAVLLNQQTPGSHRASSGFEQFSQGGDVSAFGAASPGSATPGRTSPFPNFSGAASSVGQSSRRPTLGSKTLDSADPYYRPPRPRRQTLESQVAMHRTRDSWGSNDLVTKPYKDSLDQSAEYGEGSSHGQGTMQHRNSLTPAYLRTQRDDSDLNLPGRNVTDYAVRESDFYYGVSRGPALSSLPTRRLKTGPADPMGPVSSATGWLRGLFGAKRKDKGKGFEVVRSQRAPDLMEPLDEDNTSPPTLHEPYRDSPDIQTGSRSGGHEDEEGGFDDSEVVYVPQQTGSGAPVLAPIETSGGIELPSRFGSRASSKRYIPPTMDLTQPVPNLPRKSSKRTPSADAAFLTSVQHLAPMQEVQTNEAGDHHNPSPRHRENYNLAPETRNSLSVQMPFQSAEPSPSPERLPGAGGSEASSIYPLPDEPAGSSNEQRSSNRAETVSTQGDNRSVSTGYVHHHRASDSIQPGYIEASSNLGSQAELVDESANPPNVIHAR